MRERIFVYTLFAQARKLLQIGFCAGKHQLTFAIININLVALIPRMRQKFLGELVFNKALNASAQRTRAINGIGALFCNIIAGRRRKFNFHFVRRQALVQIANHHAYNLAQLVFLKCREHNNLVNTVDKLRAKCAF